MRPAIFAATSGIAQTTFVVSANTTWTSTNMVVVSAIWSLSSFRFASQTTPSLAYLSGSLTRFSPSRVSPPHSITS